MRALEKDPARRFQTADEFIAALEAARRAPTRRRDGADAGRAVVEEEPAARAGGCGCSCARGGRARRRRLPPARRQEGRRPELRRPRRQRGRGHPARARAEVGISTASSTTSHARRGDLARTRRPATRCDEGTTVTVRVSAGPGHGGGARRRGPARGDAEQALRGRRLQRQGHARRTPTPSRRAPSSALAAGGRRRPRARHGHAARSPAGQQGVTVPGVVGNTRTQREQTLEAAGLQAEVTEQELRAAPERCSRRIRRPARSVPKGATVKLIVAKARPDGAGRDDGQPDGRGRDADAGGGRVQGASATERPAADEVGRVIGQSPEAGDARGRPAAR